MMKTILLRALLLSALALGYSAQAETPAPASKPGSPAPAADWPYTRGNPEMTGLSPTALRAPLTLAWQFKTSPDLKRKEEMMLSSAVVRNGKVYLGNKDGKFFCLDLATGKKLWESSAPKGSFEGAAGFSGDLVIAGCTDSYIYAWNADTGTPVWKYETEGEIRAAANVRADKTGTDRLYIGSYDNNLYCLEAKTGKKLWAAETGNYINGGAPVTADGQVIFGGCDSVLHFVDAETGKESKTIDIGAYVGNNVAVDSGVVYVSHYGNHVEAYSIKDSARVWDYSKRDFEYYSAPAVGEKIVVVGGRDKRMHGIDRITGKGLWEYKCKDRVDSSPVICAAKHVVFGADDGFIYVLDLSNGSEVWKYEIGAPVKTSPAVAGDWIIVGADDSVVYAFRNGK